MKLLVTGGTVFVSKSVAEYFVKRGNEVYVLNRNNMPQSEGVKLIEGDRKNLGNKLKKYEFDAVLDITAYTEEDVKCLVESLGNVKDYIFISSSAVYPETNPQPFSEEQLCGKNTIWGAYGTNKLAAEKYLQKNVPQVYILRPSYIYGPNNNIYREGFVFDCADEDRTFFIPGDGKMPLQFFHVEDLCKLIETILDKKPDEHILNVGNEETIDINEWVRLCYEAAGKKLETKNVNDLHIQRNYFSFHDYGYELDIYKQKKLLPYTKPMREGLKEAYQWYEKNQDIVSKKDYISYIDKNINQ